RVRGWCCARTIGSGSATCRRGLAAGCDRWQAIHPEAHSGCLQPQHRLLL
ncbi:unnamed protein product, partial [Effrenium voratum]